MQTNGLCRPVIRLVYSAPNAPSIVVFSHGG